jgi:regulator of replication initiation timing
MIDVETENELADLRHQLAHYQAENDRMRVSADQVARRLSTATEIVRDARWDLGELEACLSSKRLSRKALRRAYSRLHAALNDWGTT